MRWLQRTARWMLLFCGCAVSAAGQEGGLSAGFQSPPPSARPHTWWHWMDGNVTREGITADLEAMARVGIGGAQIFNIGVQIPDGPAPFKSPRWMELMHHAAQEAERLGIELCLHNCAGWSSSGGPWMTPEHAMQVVTVSETTVEGPRRFEGVLRQPDTRLAHYRDIAVLAFPSPAEDAFRIENHRAKAGFESRYGIEPDMRSVPAGTAIPRADIVDLSARMTADGSLNWDIPPGKWTVLRLGHTPTGKTNHPAPDAGRGLECDKLSRAALDVHWQGGVQPILDRLGPLVGRTLNNALIDSYEVGVNNWTPGFAAAFARRRGYDPKPFLPALTGRVVDSGAITERFLWDYRRTIADLFADNYFTYFGERCRERGMLFSVEPYDGPFECLAVGAEADIVMGEFWVGRPGHHSCRLAASVAHTHGRSIVGAESFTSGPGSGRWQNHPGSLKAQGDKMWCEGINRFIFHRYAHQPWLDRVPGMTMARWGSHFDRTSTWWEPGRAWMSYLARSQYLLQQGRFVADVLFFGGEGAPARGVALPSLKAAGYDYDSFGTDLVDKLGVEEGWVTLPSGMRYRLLVLPDTTFMTPKLARRVRELVEEGATVSGPRPSLSPSLAGYPECDLEVQEIADVLWGGGEMGERRTGKGRVVWGKTPEAILADMPLAPDFEVLSPGLDVSFIHRRTAEADLYFVANPESKAVTAECAFRVSGRRPELWDPVTGAQEPAPFWRAEGGRTQVTLPLDPAGSVFVVFRQPSNAGDDTLVSVEGDDRQPPSPPREAPRLEIQRATYGVLERATPGSVDVTDLLAQRVADGALEVVVSNDLAGDPAEGTRKSLLVEYTVGGTRHSVRIPEKERLSLPRPGEAGPLVIVGAVYGDVPPDKVGFPALAAIDVTTEVADRVTQGKVSVRADNRLAGGDPAFGVPKQLRIDYLLDGKPLTVAVAENQMLELPSRNWNAVPFSPWVQIRDGTPHLVAWTEGTYRFTYQSGKTTEIHVDEVPPPIVLSEGWELTFPAGWGAPEQVALPELISWPDHPHPGVNYFSGTATYRNEFTLPASWVATNRQVWLDLGRVEVMAEIQVNGKDFGVLWKDPYRVDLTAAAKPGTNHLEVRVTNLWPNRLIGDEQFPPDVEWEGDHLRAWPEWLLKNRPRPVPERRTFTTWKFWGRDDDLLPSGMMGPVRVLNARAEVWREKG